MYSKIPTFLAKCPFCRTDNSKYATKRDYQWFLDTKHIYYQELKQAITAVNQIVQKNQSVVKSQTTGKNNRLLNKFNQEYKPVLNQIEQLLTNLHYTDYNWL